MTTSVALVGPVLISDNLGRAVAEAICERHPEATVVDRGAYLRVSCPESCTLHARDVEAITGSSFTLPSDLERIMPSFSGKLSFEGASVTWTPFGKRPEASETP